MGYRKRVGESITVNDAVKLRIIVEERMPVVTNVIRKSHKN